MIIIIFSFFVYISDSKKKNRTPYSAQKSPSAQDKSQIKTLD